MMNSNARYQFTLRIHELDEIDKKYGLHNILEEISKSISKQSDNGEYVISDFFYDMNEHESQKCKMTDVYTILDYAPPLFQGSEGRSAQYKQWIVGGNILDKDLQMLPLQTNIHCYWCRHSFDTTPVGCPLSMRVDPSKKVHSSVIKNQIFELTETEYHRGKKIVYETDGIFCSFNCALAYAKDRNYDPEYSQSYQLLQEMYCSIYGLDGGKLTEAPSWKLLDNYGGILNIQEFRETFQVIEYEVFMKRYNNIWQQPYGSIYEKKQKNSIERVVE